jgi:D-glycero-alpha-D-manno-heptose-7-phosphate kinase
VPPIERAAEATAPTRVELAGGALGIWPLYLFHPGAVTVEVAIDRRVWCRVEPLTQGVRLESKDTLVRHEAESVEALLERDTPPLAAFVLRALGVAGGVRVSTRSRVPSGSGLGGSSAVAMAVAAAAAAAARVELPVEELWPLVRDAETQFRGLPAGAQDYVAATHGGRCSSGRPGPSRTASRPPADVGAVEECLLLASTSGTRSAGLSRWELLERYIDLDAATRQGLEEIAAVARELLSALSEGRRGDVAGLLAREWEARKRLSPAVTTPEIDRIVEIARGCGGAARACGAGGGGVVALWAEPGGRGAGARESLEAALKQAEIPVFPFRADLQGLEVELE